MLPSNDSSHFPPLEVEVAIVGAGPAGLAAACECAERGLSSIVVDRGGLAQSFVEYPHNLLFFSPPHEMEIADLPLPVAGGLKPTRETYLAYLRGLARAKRLNLLTWHAIEHFELAAGRYRLTTRLMPGGAPGPVIVASTVVIATGMWHLPCRLGVPGEELPQVLHEFFEPTPYYGQPVLVVGGGNSAVGGALSLAEAGAKVGLSMRRPPKNYRSGLRPFVKRDLAFAVEERRIDLLDNTVVQEIRPASVVLQPVRYVGSEDLSEGRTADYEPAGACFERPARFVFSLIGHRPDVDFLGRTCGLELLADGRPQVDRSTWETSRPQVFVAGSLAAPEIDIVLKLREQSRQVVAEIAGRR